MDTCNSPKSFIMLQASWNENHSLLFFIYISGGKGYGGKYLFWSEFYEETGNNTETLNVKYATYFIEVILFCLDFIMLSQPFYTAKLSPTKKPSFIILLLYWSCLFQVSGWILKNRRWKFWESSLGISAWYLFFAVLLRACGPQQV